MKQGRYYYLTFILFLMPALCSQAAEYSFDVSLDTRFSDNMRKTEKDKKSDVKNELSASLTFKDASLNYYTDNDLRARYITYTNGTYDDQWRWDGTLFLNYIFNNTAKESLTWRFFNNHYQTLIDRNGREVESNIADVNSFETGPEFLWNFSSRTSFFTNLLYINNQTSENNADSENTAFSFNLNHLFTKHYSMAANYYFTKIEIQNVEPIHRQNAYISFSLYRKNYSFNGRVGVVTYESEILAGHLDNDFYAIWDYKYSRNLSMAWDYEYTLTDTTSDINKNLTAPNLRNDFIKRERTKYRMNFKNKAWFAQLYYIYTDEYFITLEERDIKMGPGFNFGRAFAFGEVWKNKSKIDGYHHKYERFDEPYKAGQLSFETIFSRNSTKGIDLDIGYTFEYRRSSKALDGFIANEIFAGLTY